MYGNDNIMFSVIGFDSALRVPTALSFVPIDKAYYEMPMPQPGLRLPYSYGEKRRKRRSRRRRSKRVKKNYSVSKKRR